MQFWEAVREASSSDSVMLDASRASEIVEQQWKARGFSGREATRKEEHEKP